ncbi:MAG: calcium/sodium antiporter [Bacteroidales bacterium]
MEFVYLVAGLVLLLTSGEYLVRGAVSLSSHFKISKMVVGIVIVSLGTSAPELVVTLDAAIKGYPDISTGNVIGSNISNIALILGLAAILMPVTVKKKSVQLDWSLMMVASILLYIFMLNLWIEWWEGLIFVLILTSYIFLSIHYSRKEERKNAVEVVKPKYTLIVSLVLVVLSSIGLVYGADFLVKGAVNIAERYGVSERVISVSLVALGTSLPELATSIMAGIKKETDIFVGNIIGSNIFNILAILGITSIIKQIQVNPGIIDWDILWMLAISLLLFILLLPLKTGKLSRWNGLLLVAGYVSYIYLVLLNQ